MPISLSTVVVAAGSVVACELGDEAAMLNLSNGAYYGLDATGARIWKLLNGPMTVAGIRDAILRTCDVDADRCERDLLALLNDLHKEGLVEFRADLDS